jgi:ferrous iron transport protein A
MVDERQVSLVRMHSGENGKILHIDGGHGLINRLAALGIRPGKSVTKISSIFMRGPVTIEVDRIQVAIGFGMARKIFVEVEQHGA